MNGHSQIPSLPALQRWASFGGFILFFVLFPAAILYFGSQNLLRVVERQERETHLRKLERQLQRLEPWQNEQKFLDDLCVQILKKLTKLRSLKKSIHAFVSRLQLKYEGSLNLVFFHPLKGPLFVDPSLKGTHSQWTTVQRVLERANEHRYDAKFQSIPKHVSALIQDLLGPLATFRSLCVSQSSDSFLTPAAVFPEFRSVWFRAKTGDQSLLCIVETPFFSSGKYWHIIVRQCNLGLQNGIRLGFIPNQDLQNDSPHRESYQSKEDREIAIALGRFRRNQETEIETDHFLVRCRTLNRQGILYAFLVLNRVHETSRRARLFFSLLLAFLILGSFIWGYRHFIQRKTRFLSIRWQIAAIFLFATGIPLTGMAFLAHEYLVHRQNDLMNAVLLRSEQFLRQIDNRFSSTLLETQITFAELAKKLSKDLGMGIHPQENSELSHGVEESECSDFYLISDNEDPLLTRDQAMQPVGSRVLEIPSVVKERRIAGSIFSSLFRDLAGIAANPRKNLALDELVKDFVGSDASEEWRNSMIRNLGKIHYFNNLNTRVMIMLSRVTEGLSGPLKYLVLAQWPGWSLQKNHLAKAYHLAEMDKFTPRLAACAGLTLHPIRTPDPEPLLVFSRRAQIAKKTIIDSITWKGKAWLAVGVQGKNLETYTLIALSPKSTVEGRLLVLKRRLLVFGLLTMFVTIAIALTLSRSILQPLKHLSLATEAIERRRFDFRLPSLGQDEFGHLGLVFNRALESLGEIQTAGLVQTSLFPTRIAENDRWEIALIAPPGRRLGGCFAELISLPDKRLLLFLGSVGHTGVRGALTLAMFKATLARMSGSFSDLSGSVQILRESISALLSGDRQYVPVFDVVLANPVLDSLEVCRGSAGFVFDRHLGLGQTMEPLMESNTQSGATQLVRVGQSEFLLVCSSSLHKRLGRESGDAGSGRFAFLSTSLLGEKSSINDVQRELEKQLSGLSATDDDPEEYVLAVVRRRSFSVKS